MKQWFWRIAGANISGPNSSKGSAINCNNWPKLPEINTYFQIWNDLIVKSNLPFKNQNIVISAVMLSSNPNYQRIYENKSLLREKVWWPIINHDFEQFIAARHTCQVNTALHIKSLQRWHLYPSVNSKSYLSTSKYCYKLMKVVLSLLLVFPFHLHATITNISLHCKLSYPPVYPKSETMAASFVLKRLNSL